MQDSIGLPLLKEKQVRMIATLTKEREWHISDLAKEANVTYVHTSRFVSKCEQLGFIGSERHGRLKRIFLTELGKEIAKSVMALNELVSPQPKQTAEPKKEVKEEPKKTE